MKRVATERIHENLTNLTNLINLRDAYLIYKSVTVRQFFDIVVSYIDNKDKTVRYSNRDENNIIITLEEVLSAEISANRLDL